MEGVTLEGSHLFLVRPHENRIIIKPGENTIRRVFRHRVGPGDPGRTSAGRFTVEGGTFERSLLFYANRGFHEIAPRE